MESNEYSWCVNCCLLLDGCIYCVNGACRSTNNNNNNGSNNRFNFYGYNGRCSVRQCVTNFNCNFVRDGCTQCVNGFCSFPNTDRFQFQNNQLWRCGSQCYTSYDCANASDGCTACVSSRCICGGFSDRFNIVNTNRNVGCVSTEADLASRLQNQSGVILICANTKIEITSEITTSKSDITLQCQGDNCELHGSGSNRLIHFTGGNIQLTGIKFENGFSSDNGGGILIDGNNNRITRCTFTGNRSNQKGGAGAFGSGVMSANIYSGNSAYQCNDFFDSSTLQCSTW